MLTRRTTLGVLASLPLAPRAFAQARLSYDLTAKPLADGIWMVEGATEYFSMENGGAIVNVTLMKGDSGKGGAPQIQDLFIDIGVSSRKAAEKLIRVGDPITLNDQFEILRDDLAIARAFDNRVGTWAVAETLRLLKSGKTRLNVEVCAVANTMEEVGLFGARQIAYSLHPDVALVMDVTHATDYPTVDKRQHGDIKVGEGPTVTHGNCNHPEVIKRIEQVAKRLKINLQHEAISATSGTDTDAIFWTRGGIPSGLISLPNRYMHSPVEVVSLKDLEQIPQIMAGFAKSIKRGEEFKVKI